MRGRRGIQYGYFKTRIPGTKVCEMKRLASLHDRRRGAALRDGTTLEKPTFARDLRFSHGTIWILVNKESNTLRKLCMELLTVSGGRVLASVLANRTYFAGHFGSKTGIPGLRRRLTAMFIRSRV